MNGDHLTEPDAYAVLVGSNEDLTRRVDPMRQAEMAAGAFIAGFSLPTTRRTYSQDMRRYLGWLSVNFPDVHPIGGVKRGHIDLLLRSLEEEGKAVTSVARILSVVSSWYRWLVAEEYLDRNPCANVRRPKLPRESTREFLTRRELADWITGAEKAGGYPYALACLLAFNGLRISEVCGANVEDLSTEKHHRTLKIHGKGDQPDIIALPPRTVDAIMTALNGRVTGPLLLTQAGTRMNRESAGRIVRRFAIAARIAKHVTPHSIRHSAVTAYLESGADISAARDFARHVDVRTTAFYDRRRRKLDAHGSYAISNFIAEVEA